MKRTWYGLAVWLVLLLVGCSSAKVTENGGEAAHLTGVVFEDKAPGKRLILKFSPNVPSYETAHQKDGKASEIRWRVVAQQAMNKEFSFSERGSGLRKASIVVDPQKGTATLFVWHDGPEAFALVKGAMEGELILVAEETARHAASLRSADSRRRRINLSVKDAPLDKVIRTLANESQKSLVLGSNIGGSVTVALQNMTYEQAIDMILRPTQYRAEHAGDVTIIRSAKEDKSFRAFKLKFVDVNAVLKQVQDIASKDGQVSIDAASNSLFVVDRFEALRNVELMLANLDQEARQVEVEAAIISVELKDNLDLGFDWSGVVHAGNRAEVQSDINTNKLSSLDNTLSSTKGLFVGVSWRSVRGLLGALASKGKLSLLARPRLVAITDQEASIIVGSKLGYKTVTVTQNGNVEDIKFLTVGTQLKVKPHITLNNDILMYIKPEISDGAVDPRTSIPSANTTTSETRVLAKNGQTIFIGGLIRDRIEKRSDRIPFLGDIPILGHLFGGTSNTDQKNELVILLSPRIVTQDVAAFFDKEGNRVIEKFYDDNNATVPQGLSR